jgi:hypothetical protein
VLKAQSQDREAGGYQNFQVVLELVQPL